MEDAQFESLVSDVVISHRSALSPIGENFHSDMENKILRRSRSQMKLAQASVTDGPESSNMLDRGKLSWRAKTHPVSRSPERCDWR